MVKYDGPSRMQKVPVRLPDGRQGVAFRRVGSATAAPSPAIGKHLGASTRQLADSAPPTLAGQPIPLATFDEVFHIGTLNPDDRRRNYRESYEGSGLSISQHPDDWRTIARLGGYPTWTATKTGNAFLARWDLTAEQEHAINQWGVVNGYLEEVTRWQVTGYDSEQDCDYTFDCDTYEAALHEADDDPSVVREVRVLAVTDKLSALTGTTSGDTASAFDLALTVYAEHETGFDGVWWDDDYSPLALSCPRGVIFADRLDGWAFAATD